jgi:metallo-beta-lactamase family protein
MTTHVKGSSPVPAVTFWGAARSVTGSMHLVEAGDRRVLLDCGLFRGRGDAARRNTSFPFDPRRLDAVVLSHAHVDHCGNLPNLVRQGYAGPIYCTPATRDLLAVMLADSARIQEEDAAIFRIIGQPDEAACPLYTRDDARTTTDQCLPLPYGEPRAIAPGVELRFADAGHILGSAMVALTFDTPGRPTRISFTGDVGRSGLPFLRDGAPLPAADLVISESTYGGRTHEPLASLAEAMAGIVRRAAEEGGKVLIPAFSLGRTQLVVHYLHHWMENGLLPALPLFVDGRLAADVSEVYRRYPQCFDPRVMPPPGREEEFLSEPGVQHVRGLDESRELAVRRGPCIIVASSGMCEAGRILQHLKQNLDDPRCTVVLVSYQAPGTLGWRLLQPRPTVRFHGRDWNLWAHVVKLDGFSGHVDQNDLLALLGPLAGTAHKVRLVHGEPEQAEALAAALRQRGFADVDMPALGETVSAGDD